MGVRTEYPAITKGDKNRIAIRTDQYTTVWRSVDGDNIYYEICYANTDLGIVYYIAGKASDGAIAQLAKTYCTGYAKAMADVEQIMKNGDK